MRSLVTSIFLYACKSWTLTAEFQRKNKSHGNEVLTQDTTHLIQRPCFTNEEVRGRGGKTTLGKDRPGVRQVPEGSGEQGKVEKN